MQIRKKWLHKLKNFFNKHFKEYYQTSQRNIQFSRLKKKTLPINQRPRRVASLRWWEKREEKRRRPNLRRFPVTTRPANNSSNSTSGRLEQCRNGRWDRDTASCSVKNKEVSSVGDPWHWCGSGSSDSYLWLMDLDATPFFSDFKDANFFSYFFLITYPQALYLQS